MAIRNFAILAVAALTASLLFVESGSSPEGSALRGAL